VIPLLVPLLDDPLDELEPFEVLDPLLVEPFDVEPPVEGVMTVEGCVARGVVVEFADVGPWLFVVPAYVSAASQPNPAVARTPIRAVAAVSSERRRVASVRRLVRARRSGVIRRR
jgi:hypothetical protein